MEILLFLISNWEDNKLVGYGVSCSAAVCGIYTNVSVSIFCLLHVSTINSVWLQKMDFTLQVTCLCSAGGRKFSYKCLDLGLNENCSPALTRDNKTA